MATNFFRAHLGGHPWFWSFAAAFLIGGVTITYSGVSSTEALLVTALSFGAFYALCGTGQLFVITLGPGNIDLSIPATISLSAAVGMQVMAGANAMVLPGIAAALLVGCVIGIANVSLKALLGIPPILATLSSSFIIQSVAIALTAGNSVQPPAMLKDFVRAKLLGMPALSLAAIAIAALMAIVLHRTRLGRSIVAIGQNPRAAALVGIKVRRTETIAYVICGCLAALCGVFLAAFSGGNSLEMGNEYLFASIAVVVIGGTSIAGGKSTVAGVWGASLFLFLLVTMLNAFGASPGMRLMMIGLIIMGVVTLTGRKS